jgi:hypothetical protein
MKLLRQLLSLRRNEMDYDALGGARETAGVLIYAGW